MIDPAAAERQRSSDGWWVDLSTVASNTVPAPFLFNILHVWIIYCKTGELFQWFSAIAEWTVKGGVDREMS